MQKPLKYIHGIYSWSETITWLELESDKQVVVNQTQLKFHKSTKTYFLCEHCHGQAHNPEYNKMCSECSRFLTRPGEKYLTKKHLTYW